MCTELSIMNRLERADQRNYEAAKTLKKLTGEKLTPIIERIVDLVDKGHFDLRTSKRLHSYCETVRGNEQKSDGGFLYRFYHDGTIDCLKYSKDVDSQNFTLLPVVVEDDLYYYAGVESEGYFDPSGLLDPDEMVDAVEVINEAAEVILDELDEKTAIYNEVNRYLRATNV